MQLSAPAVSPEHCEIHACDGALWLAVVRPDASVTVDGKSVAPGMQAPLTANRSSIVLGGTTLALRNVSALVAKWNRARLPTPRLRLRRLHPRLPLPERFRRRHRSRDQARQPAT